MTLACSFLVYLDNFVLKFPLHTECILLSLNFFDINFFPIFFCKRLFRLCLNEVGILCKQKTVICSSSFQPSLKMTNLNVEMNFFFLILINYQVQSFVCDVNCLNPANKIRESVENAVEKLIKFKRKQSKGTNSNFFLSYAPMCIFFLLLKSIFLK